MKKQIITKLIWIICVAGFVSCNKDNFLDEKPNSALIVPTTLDDFQRLLDNYLELNYTPYLGEASSNDYYLLNYSSWQALQTQDRNSYIWSADIFEGIGGISDWNLLYKQVFTANIVLEGLNKIEPTSSNQQFRNNIKGWALFMRAHAFFNLAQLFCLPYDEATADTDLGIPIRTAPGVDEPSTRATVKKTYEQIIADLTEAKDLIFPNLQTDFRNRPCKPAALGLLARVYLNMRNYPKAFENANASLQIYNTLIDYNSISTASFTPFDRKNAETLFQSEMSGGRLLAAFVAPNTILDTTLFASYATDDLRRDHFFRPNANPLLRNRKGSYTGTIYPFGGIATDEIYLIKAECQARAGSTADAMSTLNSLLQKRWVTGTYNPPNPSTAEQALDIILNERRKELVFRGLRWQDLRRLNKEGRNITLTRVLNNQTYSLSPNTPRYVLPIPPDEIQLSGLQQNPR